MHGFIGFLLVILTSSAHATITVSSADGVSTWESGAAPIFYGGTAGDDTSCTGTGLCNNCVQAAAAALVACNRTRITASTIGRIYIQSDSKTGKATLTKSDGTNITQNASSVSSGQTTYVQFTWGNDICSNAESGYGDCEQVSAVDKNNSLAVRIGIDGDSDGQLTSTNDDYITASFRIARLMGNEVSSSAGSASAATNGIYDWSVYPGDAKVYLGYPTQITAWDGFPSSATGMVFKKVHLLYKADGDNDDTTCEASLFGNVDVNPESDSIKTQDLDSEGDLSDERFFGFANDTTFFRFKVALEDQAGNVGLFTPDSACTPDPQKHIVKPGEVFGLLKDQQNCFISTAAFGSRMSPQVEVFRNFRDKFLITNWLGRKLTLLYYDYSPKLAKAIAQDDYLRLTSRIALYPFLVFAKLALEIGFLGATLAFAILLLAFFQLWNGYQKRSRI